MSAEGTIRFIKESDAEQVLAIYAHYVEHTHITFEYPPPSLDEYRQKITSVIEQYPWLVYEEDGKIIGYAYAHVHRPRVAYQWSPEATIYLHPEYKGKGIGKILYTVLFDLLRLQGYYTVLAGVGQPNDGSNHLHKKLGFLEIGTFKDVGFKFGNWHDTVWYRLPLGERPEQPAEPIAITDIKPEAISEILRRAQLSLR